MKAYEWLERHEWCNQNYFLDAQGKSCGERDAVAACLMGAIRLAYSFVDEIEIRHKLHDRLGEWPGPWNDATGRTKAEVVALLKELDL